ncbi:MAG: hypothetical protein J3Q66DRAFT_363102 [Benniella sp.]|nr:MAG: hypothetical protein J3Q66DRAFT_363102 [Benniella sp.]
MPLPSGLILLLRVVYPSWGITPWMIHVVLLSRYYGDRFVTASCLVKAPRRGPRTERVMVERKGKEAFATRKVKGETVDLLMFCCDSGESRREKLGADRVLAVLREVSTQKMMLKVQTE